MSFFVLLVVMESNLLQLKLLIFKFCFCKYQWEIIVMVDYLIQVGEIVIIDYVFIEFDYQFMFYYQFFGSIEW